MDQFCDFRDQGNFYDDINYPRGFSKHGDFTIREAEALHKYGQTLFDLSVGLLEPQTRDEKHFAAVCNGEAEAESYLEKLWLKYKAKIRAKQVFYGVSTPVHRVSMPIENDFDPL